METPKLIKGWRRPPPPKQLVTGPSLPGSTETPAAARLRQEEPAPLTPCDSSSSAEGRRRRAREINGGRAAEVLLSCSRRAASSRTCSLRTLLLKTQLPPTRLLTAVCRMEAEVLRAQSEASERNDANGC
ncbi:uncharacterized protein V6R79_002825 [Siganus canaliculatus]